MKGLFHMEDITPVVQEKQTDIIEEIRRQRIMLKGDEPAIDIGPHCGMFYPCDFEGHCWSHIPEQSVFDVRGRFDRRFDLYRSGTVSMFDVPREYLSWKQTLQIDMAETKGFHCNLDDVADFLDSLWHPLYFFDFETFMGPIPSIFDLQFQTAGILFPEICSSRHGPGYWIRSSGYPEWRNGHGFLCTLTYAMYQMGAEFLQRIFRESGISDSD